MLQRPFLMLQVIATEKAQVKCLKRVKRLGTWLDPANLSCVDERRVVYKFRTFIVCKFCKVRVLFGILRKYELSVYLDVN